MLQWYKADLHIHTVLSPCADLSMGPRDIVHRALSRKIDFIAITDHNSAENVRAVLGAAEGFPLCVIPGMEVYVREEAHMICLFPDLERLIGFQAFVYDHILDGEYDESMFGPQIICDRYENIIGKSTRFLALPLTATLHRVADEVLKAGGLFYPAHIDRPANSILRTLGFIPANLHIDALEISFPLETARERVRLLQDTEYTLIRASDAHDIEQIGSAVTYIRCERPSFTELARAIKKDGGRCTALKI
jgi:PHP family Zn ribbon phosphoesterase